MAETTTYVAKRDGFIMGTWRNRNAHVEMTEAQARAFLRDGAIEALDREPARPAPAADEPIRAAVAEPSPEPVQRKGR